MKGILGRKSGMTTVFSNEGKAIPVTVIEVKPNVVLQVKTKDKDGYTSVKLGVEDKKNTKAIKPELGVAKKANTSAKYFIKEIRNMEGHSQGDKLNVSLFEKGEYVDVVGTSKGKGFQGSIKRHNQSRGPMTHGSKSHRVTGSLGDIRGTVKKTKKMPGHMGHEQVTMQNLKVILSDIENNVILVKGSIPGPNKSFVVIKEAVKSNNKPFEVEMVNVKNESIKNELLEEAKKYGANVNTGMQINEMKTLIEAAKEQHHKDLEEHKVLIEEAKKLNISKAVTMKLDELRTAIAKAKEIEASRAQNTSSEDNKEGEEK